MLYPAATRPCASVFSGICCQDCLKTSRMTAPSSRYHDEQISYSGHLSHTEEKYQIATPRKHAMSSNLPEVVKGFARSAIHYESHAEVQLQSAGRLCA